MTGAVRLATRAAVQVLLVAASSVTLAAYGATGHADKLGMGTALGFGISWVWWGNARAASLSNIPRGRFWYAVGAALGTMAGAFLARVFLTYS